MRRRSTRGWLLIDALIAIAIFGLLSVAAWSIRGHVVGAGSGGLRALRVRQATELLVEAQQRALLEPLAIGEASLPSRVGAVRLARAVEGAGPGLLRVTLRATWDEGDRPRTRTLVTLRGER